MEQFLKKKLFIQLFLSKIRNRRPFSLTLKCTVGVEAGKGHGHSNVM